jgi:hypothetical protein
MAMSEAWKVFSDPESRIRDLSIDDRKKYYGHAWDYYRGEMFSRRNGANWTIYLATRELYKHTRLIYNPVPQIVDFYVDNLWQPAANEDFESLVTPVTDKTDEKIIAAIAQIDQWSNFLSDAPKIKRYASATGNVLIEGIDDPVREKVLHRTIWPGYVADIELNATGDVQAYTLEYDFYDRATKSNFRFKKIVTKDTYSYFKDDKPFIPEGKTSAVEPNPYKFCFAVWIRHTDDGSDYGLPACKDFNKVDELNSLASHLHDNIRKTIESPKLISTDEDVLPLIGATKNPTTKTLVPQDPRLNWVVFKTKSGAGVHDLAGSLKLEEANPYLKDCLTSFTDDYPELQAATIIRENSQLSGAALERMLGPAQNRLNGVQPNYNQQLIKLRQMQLAVAGMRANGGGWSTSDSQKDVFKPFGLQSYERGDLNFSLKRSALVQSTEAEDEDLLIKKAQRATTLEGIVDGREQLSIAGYSDEQIDEIEERKKKAAELEFEEEEKDPEPEPEPEPDNE